MNPQSRLLNFFSLSILVFSYYIKRKSSSTYDSLWKSGFINLPNERTPFDCTNTTTKGTGFQDVIKMMYDEVYGKKEQVQDFEKRKCGIVTR